eukprot:9474633-Pyramimonas_sp.AAC.1
MPPPAYSGALLTRFVAPQGAPPEAPAVAPACRRHTTLVHPSHASWPHADRHLRPKWLCPHAAATPFWRTRYTVGVHIGRSI